MSRLFRSIITNGVTAHRGNSAEYPENTLIAFESALSLSVDWIELDILRTRDGNLVAIHDETTKRVGDLELKVNEVNYDELKDVDVAFYFRKERKLPIEICPKMTAPLLSEVINLVKTQHKTRISIHPKASIVEEIFFMLKKFDAVKWVGFNGTELEYMIRVKSLDKSIPVFFDRFQTDLTKDIPLAALYGFESIIIHNSQVNKNNIESIHDAGLICGCWTVDDPILMDTYLTIGIDIIYTNDPKKLLAIKCK